MFWFYYLLENRLLSDFDVSFEDGKCVIALDNCDSLPSTISPKHLSIEICVIAHIVKTTLLS